MTQMILTPEDCESPDSSFSLDEGMAQWEGYNNRADFIDVFEASLKKKEKEKEKKNSSNSSQKTIENSLYTQNEIKYKFYWKEGGQKVQLAGNFCGNWKNRYDMKKNPENGFFEYEMTLAKNVYQFKFLIDSEWKCSKYYGVMKDKRSIPNNFIDLTNYSKAIPVNGQKNKAEEDKKKAKLGSMDADDYDCVLPKIEEFAEVPSLPECYKTSFELDVKSKQDDLGKKKHLKEGRRGSLCEKTSYKEIVPPSHDKLLHLCSEIKRTKTEKNKNDWKNCIKTTTTQKLKNKFVTLVFYKDY